ncbi:hypothetical protein jhhlp_002760 [Lomentospora prolificans]|uniref:Alcohol dehydrogenase-like N-terminal domain-containing protein n=1 Tax=Lomentospora prolificans TaxID=41688 RepID=A0A2N3NF19_9PEZI|nr:hypothetical protein jhhlp_002760 [Lomentospora prolificans]
MTEATQTWAVPQDDAPNPYVIVTADHQIHIHFWRHARIGALTVDGDCVLGHEASGVVLKLGHGLEDLQPDAFVPESTLNRDRVAVEPGVPCGHCHCFRCVDGHYNLYPDVAFAGVYPSHGTIQRYKVHRANHVHKLPDKVTLEQAALLEPVAVALHALCTAPVQVG